MSWRLATALVALSTLVLLIASANVVALGTGRGVARRLEFATRAALGASTWRLGRQVLIEMLLLAAAGCVGAVFVARGLVFAFASAVPATLVRFAVGPAVAESAVAVDAPIDWRVLLYAAGASAGVALIVGLICARQARRPGLLGTLSSGAVGSQPFSRTIGRLVVVPQLSLCVVLLVVAGVLTRAIVRAESVTPGYDVPALVSIEFTPPAPCRDVLRRQTALSPAYRAARDRFHGAVLAAVRGVSGVIDASLTSVLPLETPHAGRTWVMARETTDPTGRFRGISAARVSAGYFATLRIPVLQGRGFDAGDERGEAPVVILSEALARRWWGAANPIGQQVSFTDPESSTPPRWMQVVGIVGDVGSAMDPTGANPAAYTPLRDGGFARAIVIRSGSASPAWRRDIRRAIAGIDAAFDIGEVVPVEDAIQNYLYPRRLGAQVLAVSALCGLLLAAVGIYGLVAYAVARRAREIGIRMALGATRGQVLRLVGREAVAMALAGSILGTILGYAAVRITSHALVPLPSLDAVTLVIVPLALIIAVIAASYLPARRAARTDPVIALRDL